MSKRVRTPNSSVNLSEISTTSTTHQPIPPTPIQVIMSANNTPRANAGASNHSLNDNFTLKPNQNNNTRNANKSLSNLQQYSINSVHSTNHHLYDQVASEVDLSYFLGQQKHLFAHTPGTTFHHAQTAFSVSYKILLPLLTFLFSLHWFNHSLFETVLENKGKTNDKDHYKHSLHFTDYQVTYILLAHLIGIILCAPIIGYFVRNLHPLRCLWAGFIIITIATMTTSWSEKYFAAMFLLSFCIHILSICLNICCV